MILERELSVREILDWLQAEAQARQISLTVFPDSAEERTEQYFTADGEERSFTFLGVRVRIDNLSDPGKEAKLMVRLQESWNNREPRPEKLLHLIPSGVPQGVW